MRDKVIFTAESETIITSLLGKTLPEPFTLRKGDEIILRCDLPMKGDPPREESSDA